MNKLAKLAYRPVGIGTGMLAGSASRALFKQVWRRVANEEDAPDALQPQYTLGKVLLAAGIEGAVFAVVKALVDRTGAKVFEKLTGAWPGN